MQIAMECKCLFLIYQAPIVIAFGYDTGLCVC